MAIKVGGVEVVDNNRQLKNIGSVDSGSVNVLNSALNTDPTRGTLTKTFSNGETASITLNQNVSTAPVVSVIKEVSQTGITSKGAWDVNSTASNYDLHNTAYNTTLTPSSTTTTGSFSTLSNVSGTFLSVSSVFGNPRGIRLSSDGTKVYVINEHRSTGQDTIRQWNLSTAFDLSTATHYGDFAETQSEQYARGFDFNGNGTKLFIVGYSQNTVHEYSLSTAYDVTTATATSNTFSVSSITTPSYLTFGDSGSKMYVTSGGNGNIYQYTLSTAYDITTVTNTQVISNPNANYGAVRGIQFADNGSTYYSLVQDTNWKIYENTLSTAYDINSTVTQTGVVDISGQVQNPFGLHVDGRHFYTYDIQSGNQYAYYYTLAQNTVNNLALGTGSFASTDVGKRIKGNGGSVVLTSTSGSYSTTGGSEFTDFTTIASGSWTMHGLQSAGDDDGLTLAGVVSTSTISLLDIFNDNSCQYLLELDNDLLDTGGNYNASGSNSFNTGSKYGTHAFYTGSANTFTSQINQPENSGWMMSFWFRRDGVSGLTSNNRMVDFKENTTSQGTTISFENDNQFHFILRANQHGNGSRSFGGSSLCDDSWHHIVVGSGNGSTVLAYLDGVAITSDSGKNRSDSHEGTGILWGTGYGGNCTNSYYDQIRYFNRALTASEVLALYDEGGGTGYIPTSQYHVGVTNVGGQIDTTTWQDINSMTADQNLNAGEAYYAVSTDDRTTWSVAKGSDGVRPIVRDNAGTWQYNSQESSSTVGWDVANGTYDNKNRFLDGSINGFEISNDGTKIYYVKNNLQTYQRTLTTAYDVSTAGAESTVTTSTQDGDPRDVTLSADGTKMYLLGDTNNSIFQYTLSTAWDITTATYASKSFNMTSQDTSPFSLEFKYDGTRMWVLGNNTKYIYQFDLSTAWDVSTASYNNVRFLTTSSGLVSAPKGIVVKSDGSELYMVDSDYDRVYVYDFGTNFDLSTLSYSNTAFDHTSETTNPRDIAFSNDGQKMYVIDFSNYVYQYSTDTTIITYSTGTTWTDATTNDEFYALQQALGATSVNRMDKTQLDAVADGSHFTLGDTLDLMIALKQDTSSGNPPNSDGVSINYDAEALNQGAVLGTDYDFDFPASNRVRITSNAAQNLKIRVV
ncbi:hypothetical protein CRP738_gp33 [Roseobacter phage CRP-738]|nr:hypothetical protein CRP738_gp33 [Roseobacter phage CRP-738]